jgi:diadenosine tetraphosphate (Ap4A) HIT family hydrolase
MSDRVISPKNRTSASSVGDARGTTFGPTLARITSALREETGAERVYIYVFGGSVPDLHLHLAPHHAGDALNDQIFRGVFIAKKLPSGLELIESKDFPPLPEAELRALAERLRTRLA